jgi:hypothetical protein|tara:strand:- start:2018 stop:2215 length:198 start_codon:yes stop_codon:yes gene_type:complete
MSKIKKVNPEHLWSLSDYGRLIGESPQIVKYWVKVKKLNSVKIRGGNSMIIHDPEITAFNPRTQK